MRGRCGVGPRLPRGSICEALRNELQRGALDGARERDAELRAANARAEEPALELRALRRAAAGLREELRAESGAGGEAREAPEPGAPKRAQLSETPVGRGGPFLPEVISIVSTIVIISIITIILVSTMIIIIVIVYT